MHNRYYNVIDKIKADKDFKEQLVSNLEQQYQRMNREENEVKEGIFIKVKRVVIAIITTLAMLVTSGVVYASLGGTINNVPILEWLGIRFSDNYAEYVESVENQMLENEDVKITLESTVSDYEFTVLQFRVEISEEKINSYKTGKEMEDEEWEVPFYGLSFNDPVKRDGNHQYTELNGANCNLIIDGEKVWVTSNKVVQSIEKISESEYLVYQMWILDQYFLDIKKEFEITLNDIAVRLGEECVPINGNFKVKISKERAIENTNTIYPKSNTTLKYKSMEKSIEKIYITPLQNVVEVKTIYRDVNLNNLTVSDKDYIGWINYVAFDQDDSIISSYATEVKNKINYEDGTYETVEIITVEQNENINQIKLKLYEVSGYYETIRGIMEYQIDLNTNQVKAENRDVLIYDAKNSLITDEYKVYYKKFHGVEYEQYEQVVNDNELTEHLDIIPSSVNYIDIELLDKTRDVYTEPLVIKDTIVIEELVSKINDSYEYENFEEKVGAEENIKVGAPILTIYLQNGKKMRVIPFNYQNDQADFINVMMVCDVLEPENEVNCKMYVVTSDLAKMIEKIYSKYKE